MPGAFDEKNVFLRGTTLRNTSYVYGLVLNTGYDTKIMMSSSEVPFKTSALDLSVNREIWNMLLLEFVLCVVGATGSVILVSKISPNFPCSEWAVIACSEWVVIAHFFFQAYVEGQDLVFGFGHYMAE